MTELLQWFYTYSPVIYLQYKVKLQASHRCTNLMCQSADNIFFARFWTFSNRQYRLFIWWPYSVAI